LPFTLALAGMDDVVINNLLRKKFSVKIQKEVTVVKAFVCIYFKWHGIFKYINLSKLRQLRNLIEKSLLVVEKLHFVQWDMLGYFESRCTYMPDQYICVISDHIYEEGNRSIR